MNKGNKKYYKNLYKKLSDQYTIEELVESFVFPPDLSEEEKAVAAKELWEHRKKLFQNRSEEDIKPDSEHKKTEMDKVKEVIFKRA